MSFGTFSTSLTTYDRYGIPWKTAPKGLMMDIDRILHQTVDKNNDLKNVITYNTTQGVRESANEHLVPEQLFDNPNTTEKEVEGVSAVKAIQIAAKQGQKIFTITKDNYNEAISQINLSAGAMSDIRNAINAGKTVTTHQSNISYHGWNGSGYIILDPTTGAGAYLISGGANGGFAFALGLAFGAMLVAAFIGIVGTVGFGVAATAPFLLGFAAPIIAFFLILVSVMLYKYRDDPFVIGCFVGGLLFNIGIGLGEIGRNWGVFGGFMSGVSGVNSWGQCYGG